MREPTEGRFASDEATSLTLIDRVQRSDPQAWTRFVQLYAPLIFHWCTRRGLSPADATDLGQEVFLKVASSIGTFKKDQPSDSLRAWLRVITQRKIVDYIRKRNRQLPTVRMVAEAELAQSDEPLSAFELDEEQQILYRRAIELLERDFTEVTIKAFMLSIVDGLPAATVAEKLGITLNAVYIAKSRVLAKLRADLVDN